MESICASQPAGSARLFCGHKERQMLRFDSKNSGTKLPGHITLIFSADIRWKAFATKKTVTPFVESVKNTQLSGAEGSDVAKGSDEITGGRFGPLESQPEGITLAWMPRTNAHVAVAVIASWRRDLHVQNKRL